MDSHLTIHNTEIQALNQLEAKVGIDGSADTNSIDYKLSQAETKLGSLTLADITDVTAGVGAVNYVDLTSSAQTQLDSKASKITSGVENNLVSIDGVENIKDSGYSPSDFVSASSSSVTSSATPTPTGDAKTNELYVTALAVAAELQAPSGTPVNGNKLIVRIKDDGTARALTYNAIYSGIVDTLPSTTTASKVLYMGFIYNSTTSKWEMIAKVEEV